MATDDRREVVPLPSLVSTIGRDPSCDIVLQHGSISGKHAKISFEHAKCVFEDLKSRNGTFINDNPLPPGTKIEVRSDTPVTLGTVSCLFVQESPKGDEEEEHEQVGLVATYLVRTGQLTPMQSREALVEVRENERNMGEYLVQTGLLSPKEWAEVKSQEKMIQMLLGSGQKKGSNRFVLGIVFLLVIVGVVVTKLLGVW